MSDGLPMRIRDPDCLLSRVARFAGAAILAAPIHSAICQAVIQGRVTSDTGNAPVVGASVSVPTLRIEAATDSAGRFKVGGLRSGEYLVVLRAVGFRAESVLVEVETDMVMVRDFILHPAAVPIAGPRITGRADTAVAAKLAGFRDRQRSGIGHFVTREMLTRDEDRLHVGDVLSKLPGVAVKRGGSKAWIATSRAPNASGEGCALCSTPRRASSGGRGIAGMNPADWAAGARPACYMDVYVDGTLVYNDNQRPDALLFDVNSFQLRDIEAIEVYTSAAQIPAQYNRTSTGCGVLLIWTRV